MVRNNPVKFYLERRIINLVGNVRIKKDSATILDLNLVARP